MSKRRVLRGGSYVSGTRSLLTSYRYCFRVEPKGRVRVSGFRVVIRRVRREI
jgi:hypothetical protein